MFFFFLKKIFFYQIWHFRAMIFFWVFFLNKIIFPICTSIYCFHFFLLFFFWQRWVTVHSLCFVYYHFVVKMMQDFKMKVLYCLILISLAITPLNFMLICFVINQRHQIMQQNRELIWYIRF